MQRQEVVPVLTAGRREEAAPLYCWKLDAGTFTLQMRAMKQRDSVVTLSWQPLDLALVMALSRCWRTWTEGSVSRRVGGMRWRDRERKGEKGWWRGGGVRERTVEFNVQVVELRHPTKSVCLSVCLRVWARVCVRACVWFLDLTV